MKPVDGSQRPVAVGLHVVVARVEVLEVEVGPASTVGARPTEVERDRRAVDQVTGGAVDADRDHVGRDAMPEADQDPESPVVDRAAVVAGRIGRLVEARLDTSDESVGEDRGRLGWLGGGVGAWLALAGGVVPWGLASGVGVATATVGDGDAVALGPPSNTPPMMAPPSRARMPSPRNKTKTRPVTPPFESSPSPAVIVGVPGATGGGGMAATGGDGGGGGAGSGSGTGSGSGGLGWGFHRCVARCVLRWRLGLGTTASLGRRDRGDHDRGGGDIGRVDGAASGAGSVGWRRCRRLAGPSRLGGPWRLGRSSVHLAQVVHPLTTDGTGGTRAPATAPRAAWSSGSGSKRSAPDHGAPGSVTSLPRRKTSDPSAPSGSRKPPWRAAPHSLQKGAGGVQRPQVGQSTSPRASGIGAHCAPTGSVGATRPSVSSNAMRRINVVGTSGSGKTTIGSALAGRLDVPYVELDALAWKPGWVMVEPDGAQNPRGGGRRDRRVGR